MIVQNYYKISLAQAIPLPLIHRSQCPVAFQWLFLLLQSEPDAYLHAKLADAASAVVQPSPFSNLQHTPHFNIIGYTPSDPNEHAQIVAYARAGKGRCYMFLL
jgi:hypothetical protein